MRGLYCIRFSENYFFCSWSCVNDYILPLVSSITIWFLILKGPKDYNMWKDQYLVAVVALKDKWSSDCVGCVKILLLDEMLSAASRFYPSYIWRFYIISVRWHYISGGCISTSVKQILFLWNTQLYWGLWLTVAHKKSHRDTTWLAVLK